MYPVRYRFTVDEYYRMADAGLFGEDDRVELIEGEILEMAAIGSRHAACVGRLNRLLTDLVGHRAIVQVQNPVRLSDLSEPQPDLLVLRERDDFYASGHPGPGDVYLVVEVADTTLGFDRGTKAPLYGRSGIPVYWLVDLEHEEVVVCSGPGPDGYQQLDRHQRGEALTLAGPVGGTIAVADILGT